MRPERIFLGWDQPLSEQAAKYLFEQVGTGPWSDLSHWLVIVPTQESGRILRGALCLRRPEGFLAPRVVTPMELYGQRSSSEQRRAGRTARLWAWAQLLLSKEQTADMTLFPDGPGERDFAWALGLSRSFCQAEDLLSEGGLTFASAREATGHAEPELWLRLAQMEERHRAILACAGLRDPNEVRFEALGEATWNFDAARVALVGCPDPHPLALRLLETVLPDQDCFVLIQAPEELAGGFDGWGRPDPSFWLNRHLPFPPHTRIYAEESEVARRTADLVEANRSWDAVTIGVCAPRLRPYLRLALEERGIATFDPSGSPVQGSGWASLLADLRELLREKSLTAFRRLLCHPAAAEWLGVRGDRGSRASLLEAIDRAASRTLSKAFPSAARREAVLEPFVERAERFLSQAEEEPLAAIRKLCDELFGGREGGDGHPVLSEALAVALEEMEALCAAQMRPLDAAEYLDLLIDLFTQQELPEERPEEAVEVRGWLELLWDDAPHLIVAGFQEGAIPESVAHDFLLPAALRERLGLRTNAQREARDAYLFEAIVAQRREQGRVDVLASRFSREGEPLFPSRLLLRCPPEALPERMRRLLAVRDSPLRHQPAATDSFLLRIGPLRWEREKKLPITALRDYLACPFFFYLRRARGWEAVEWLPEELDAREFGALLHEVLADFGLSDEMRECDRREQIEECLRDLLSRRLQRRLPAGIPPAVALQVRALEGRLAGFACAQAKEVQDGWRTVAVEESIALPIRDWVVEGRIDRVDRDPEGKIRLLDFKSPERARNPISAHLTAAKSGDGPVASFFQWQEKRLRWIDLQLPLYAAAWRRRNSEPIDIQVAYFVLPKAQEQAGVCVWREWGRELEAEAKACAARVLGEIEEGHFWPPERSAEWEREPWRTWFDGRPGEIVSPVLAAG